MRENRTPGSARGLVGNDESYLNAEKMETVAHEYGHKAFRTGFHLWEDIVEPAEGRLDFSGAMRAFRTADYPHLVMNHNYETYFNAVVSSLEITIRLNHGLGFGGHSYTTFPTRRNSLAPDACSLRGGCR